MAVGKRKRRYRRYLSSPHWQRVRLEALEHYGRVCGNCQGTDRLHVHHKTYKRKGRELLEDLEVLCEKCHAQLHREKRKRRRTSKTFIHPTRRLDPPEWAELRERMIAQNARLREARAAAVRQDPKSRKVANSGGL